METWQIILGSIISLIAILLGIYVSFTARKKGPIFSNTYLWFSEEERKNVDRNSEYRLVTVVCSALAIAFALLAINIFTRLLVPFILMWVTFAFVIVYAVVDSIKSYKKI